MSWHFFAVQSLAAPFLSPSSTSTCPSKEIFGVSWEQHARLVSEGRYDATSQVADLAPLVKERARLASERRVASSGPRRELTRSARPHAYHSRSPLSKTHAPLTSRRYIPADAEPGIAVRNPEEPANDTARDENLTAFYERGIGSSDWRVYHGEHVRVLYVGNTTSNLHQLVETSGSGNRLHYSYPPIKPALPWRPAVEVCPNTYLNQANAQDLSSLPAQDVRDALIETYFNDIHPGFPVIDQEHFRKQYTDAADPPPLLLLHSMLLAAARSKISFTGRLEDPRSVSPRSASENVAPSTAAGQVLA
ncbi:Acetamidase regulatory protein [Pseudocercospora fuligena]|uniref:Acetamidase regulatory protein n=1 Tax=Pseudocercospora fuligena TaxID=685502 RepID=A0A8H6RDH1_9PEZI|nr:Acetamidase regulatory protein [Pseudocercospora fuligena]